MNPLVIVAAIAFCVGGAVVGEFQEWRLDRLQTKYDKFVGETKHAGELAQKTTELKEAKDNILKERTDAERNATLAAVTAERDRLRRGAGRSIVPQGPANSRRPDLACFDRTEFGAAIDGFRSEVRGFAEEGTTFTVDLNSAKTWAQSPTTPPAKAPTKEVK